MKYLTICIDDGMKETYNNIMPILFRNDIKATWGICSGIADLGGYPLIDPQYVDHLKSSGHEIADHGYKHLTIDKDNIGERKRLGDFYIYPFGKLCNDKGWQQEISKYYLRARGIRNGVNSLFPKMNWFNLRTYMLIGKGEDRIEPSKIIEIMKSIKSNQWLILTVHLVTNRNVDYKFTYSVDEFNEVVNNIPDDVSILTTKKIYKEVKKWEW